MSKNSEALNRDLYELLRGRGFKPTMLSTAGKSTPVPEEAGVFQFNFIKDGHDYGKVSITIDGDNKLIVYYGDDVAKSPDTNTSGTQYSDSWSSLVRLLSSWRFRNGLRKFDLENEDHLESDMARREHVRKQEQIAEGYYAMGKKASYSDSVPTVKMVIQHSRQIEEGEQRYRNVARIFLENQEGERFLAPTTRPGIAKVYARHIAEGGKPHDDRWNHIGSLCEEYQKMAGFVRATRGQQFNESAQQLVESGINHYNSLRESLSKMTGHRGYNMYFESWTPPLMEDESDTTSINELFVQETLDPRIESVMPILSKLHKQVSEMSEVSALSEWADSLLEGGDGGEASEETEVETSADAGEPGGEDAPEDNLSEGDGGQEALNPIGVPESEGRLSSDTYELIDQYINEIEPSADREEIARDILNGHIHTSELEYALQDDLEESGLQAYLGNKKYGKEGMDALRNAGRDHAGKEKMANIRAKYDKLDEVEIEEVDMGQADSSLRNQPKQNDDKMDHFTALGKASKKMGHDHYMDVPDDKLEALKAMVRRFRAGEEVDEGLDADQKRAGQWGPTGGPATIGDLVGENFINTDVQAVVSEDDLEEMDSQGYTGTRDDYGSGSGPDRYGKMTTAKKIASAGLNILNKEMNQVQDRKTGKMYDPNKEFSKTMNSPEVQAQMKRMATKEDVLEGQEDLDAILRIVRK